MGQHRLPSPAGRRRLGALALGAGGALLLPAVAAHAEPKPSLEQVQRQVDTLYEEAEAATEQYNGLQERQQQLQARTGTLQQELAVQQGRFNALRETLGAVAAAQYRTGGLDPAVRLMLTSDADDFLESAGRQDTAAATQVGALEQLKGQQRRLDQLRAETAGRLGELDGARQAAAAKKAEVQGRLAEVQRILGGLKAGERARVLAGDRPAASRSSARTPYTGPATGRTKDILDFAHAQLGKPYVYGATGPGSYDCSGLTLKAFAAGGVSLPRTSQAQFAAGQKIDKSQLQPGDLVFYYADLHHVGIYLGDGKLLHAPRTGKTVEIVGVDVMPYAGAVRY
ncbi:NlpC/P60 family protein [Kitasatospora sp. NPDC048540]|uniref:C40 family peptidase n=1 Tax=Kitasatospora sp. NPDC048540 TaxID=3155634 RepID=UPI0033FC0E10